MKTTPRIPTPRIPVPRIPVPRIPAPRIPNVLTIAGVDPSGGAGVLADLKTFSALGAYGTGVVAALTAQNTTGVTGVHAVPVDFIEQQIDTLFADVRIDAVKLGMLGTAEITRAVAARLRHHGVTRLVVDPVMVAKSGHHLLAEDAVAALRDEVLPLAEVLTPNLPEAEVLLGGGAIRDVAGGAVRDVTGGAGRDVTGGAIRDVARMRDAARRLRALGPRVVMVKGGHLPGAECVDVIDDGAGQLELRSPRIATRNTHGTGCTLSAAIAALLPRRASVREAIRDARDYLMGALAAADELSVGRGHGPVQHFWRQWKADAHPGG
jgi:hydroxymethylpyrimidine/phosphomethylpyrimidine kinase